MGLAFGGFVFVIDALCFFAYLDQKIAIALDIGAAGSTDLNEAEFALIVGMFVEHALDGPEALEDALSVIHAIDADAEEADVNAELVENFSPHHGPLAVDIAFVLRIGIGDADGKWADQRLMALAADRKTIPVGVGFQSAIHGLEKIIAMRLNVKADQIGAEQAVQEFALPGTDPERFGIGPGNVPEDRDASVGALLFDQARQKREVIVLNQNNRGFACPRNSSRTTLANFSFTR